MLRLLAVVGGLAGVLIVPLALVGPTSLLLLPAHLLFSVVVCAGSLGEGLAARPERARIWGLWFLISSIATVAALQVGSERADSSYWLLPWTAMLLWSWIPPVVSGLAGWAGQWWRDLRSRRAARSRREAEPRKQLV